MTEDDQQRSRIAGDHPIESSEDDALGRTELAHRLAHQLLALDSSQGLVAGVLGPWGSGKTSLINLVREELRSANATLLEFNPWVFSGAEQLVASFFVELAAQLEERSGFDQVARRITEYGDAFSGLGWLPFLGPWLERGRGVAKLLGKLLKRSEGGLAERRERLTSSLEELEYPLVVVIDDIDRLEASEIRDVFKLVRLTASFPNVIYLVAFDRMVVESALDDENIPGRDYLEKILQVAIDLPVIPDRVLKTQVFSAIDDALEAVDDTGPFNEDDWPDVFMEIVWPLIGNMRDVKRYAAGVYGTIDSLDGGVELVDVLGLEAVRIFLPDVFRQLTEAVEGLTTTSSIGGGRRREPPHLAEQVEAVVQAAGKDRPVVEALIKRLFPAGQRHIGGSHYGDDWKGKWLRNRRVAHEDIFRLYLERTVGASLDAFIDAERAWRLLDDRAALREYLRSLEPERLEDVISSLEVFEDDFSPDHAVPGTIVLLNLISDIPDRPRGMMDFGPRLPVTRVVLRLLRALDGAAAVERAVRQILPELHSLSAKLELVSIAGHQEGKGHELVSEQAATELESEWRQEVRQATADELTGEWDILRVLYNAKNQGEDEEDQVEIEDEPALTLAILSQAQTETLRQSMGSRAVHRMPRLQWDTLIDLYEDEEVLADRIETLREADLEGSDEVLELAERYLAGWRPEEARDP